jgi:Emfourin
MGDSGARLRLTRTGGIAGVAAEADVDTDALEPDEAQAILRALDEADLDGLERRPAPPAGPPDAFAYRLDVRRGATEHRIAFTDADMPPELEPVVHSLSRRARPARRR